MEREECAVLQSILDRARDLTGFSYHFCDSELNYAIGCVGLDGIKSVRLQSAYAGAPDLTLKLWIDDMQRLRWSVSR